MVKKDQLSESHYKDFIGKEIGNCKIKEFIGKGGMGIVFKAIHTSLNREVAVKILNPTGKDDKAIDWFIREARSIAKLEHPNIVQIYDLSFSEELDTYYIIMQYIDGPSLDVMVKRSQQKRLPPLEALDYILQTAKGLGAAHKKGIIHRDVKPANIMVTKDKVVKITDFGLAKGLETHESTMSAGLIVGTPLYMAPEQCVGSKIDERTDIYSLGASFYFLLTGRPPFTGNNTFEILEKHITEVPLPPHELVPGIPIEISKIVLKMLEKSPKDRFQNCEEIIEKINEIVETLTTVKCPRCGRENSIKDVFTCPECKTKNLCRSHIYPGTNMCEECAFISKKIEIYQTSGVTKKELYRTLSKIANEKRRGILSFRSGDYNLLIHILANKIEVALENYTLEDISQQYGELNPLEITELLLVQALTLEPFTWEFSEERPGEDFPAESFEIKNINPHQFLISYSKIVEIAEALENEGGLVINSPLQSLGIIFGKENIKVATLSSDKEIVQSLDIENTKTALEKIFNSNYKLEYRDISTLKIQGITSEGSLASIFYEILGQYPDFNFFFHLVPQIDTIIKDIDPDDRKYQLNPDLLSGIYNKLTYIFKQGIKQKKILERIGVESLLSYLICTCIIKEKILDAIERLSNILKVFEEKDNEKAVDILLEEILSLFPYNIKLLEELAEKNEEEEKLERAAKFWSKAGELRERLGEMDLARSCYEKALNVDNNNPDAHYSLFKICLQKCSPEQTKKMGIEIIPILRRAGRMEDVVEICNTLLKMDKDLDICYKELINYYLDKNEINKAIENYEELADLYKRKEDKEALIRTYQKILRLDPNREDIKAKLAQETDVEAPLVKAAMEATSVIKHKMRTSRITTYTLLGILGILIILIIIREIEGIKKLKYFEKMIKEGKFYSIKDDMLNFLQNWYILGSSDKASSLYYIELSKYHQQLVRKAQLELLRQIKELKNDYIGKNRHDYQKLLEELYNLEEWIDKQDPSIKVKLEVILKRYISNIKKEKRRYEQKRNKKLFEKAKKFIEKGKFNIAKELLLTIQKSNSSIWNERIKEYLIYLEQKKEEWKRNIEKKKKEQKKFYEKARKYQIQGKIEKAISYFEKALSVFPESNIAHECDICIKELKETLRNAKELKNKAFHLIKIKKYKDAIELLERLIKDENLKSTSIVKDIKFPLLIETKIEKIENTTFKPIKNIPIKIWDDEIGNTPYIYMYSPFKINSEILNSIKITNKAFSVLKREVKRTLNYNPWKLTLYIKRISLWKYETNRIIESPILINKNYLYIGSRDNYLYALNKKGIELWRVYTGRLSEIKGEMVIYKNKIYLTTLRGGIYIISIDREYIDPNERILYSLNIKNEKFYEGPSVYKGIIFVGGKSGNFYILYPKKGRLRIYRKINLKYRIKAKPLVLKKYVIVGREDGYIYCINWKKNKILWKSRKLTGKIIGSPIYKNGRIFTVTQGGGIYCITLKKGKILWYRVVPGGSRVRPIIYKNMLIIGAKYRNIYFLDIYNGRILKVINTEVGFSAHPLIYKDKLFISGEDFYIYGISLKNKKLLWKQSLNEESFGRPACDNENIYIATGNIVEAIWIKDILEEE